MIRVLAIDDEPLALQQLVAYIRKIPFLELVAECQSAIQAQEVLNQEPVDAIFCDINMPDLNGMDFVKSLAVPPLIVFTTAYSEYAVEGFKVDAVDYLLKPFGLQDFQRAANRLLSRKEEREKRKENTQSSDASSSSIPLPSSSENDDTIFVKTDYRVVKLAVSDIRYVEGMSEYVKIYLDNDKPLTVLLAMKRLEDRLPANFMRIHRSYIVNLDKVQELNKNRVILDAETFLPIGENYREQLVKYVEDRFLSK